jgi:hypothetical protein
LKPFAEAFLMEPMWLDWTRRLNALTQTGLTFAADPYDIERYTAIRTIAAWMIASGDYDAWKRYRDQIVGESG